MSDVPDTSLQPPGLLDEKTVTPLPVWRPLRVAFILSSLRLSGGVRAVVEYSNRLVDRGHRVTLVTPRGTIEPEMAAEIGPGVSVRESSVPLRVGGALPNARLAWSLAHATPHSDVVVSTHTPTTVSGLFASRILRRGCPVWLFMDYAGMFQGRPLAGWLLRNALRWHRLALTISQSSASELASYAPGRIEVVGLGMGNAGLLQPVPFDKRPRGHPRIILYVGDSRPRKGLSDLLIAAEKVQHRGHAIRLVLASKQEFIPKTPLAVDFRLRPTNEELAHLYQSCDLFVSASWSEGLGWPALEAMACAAPVVLTDSGGPREYAADGINCLVVPPRLRRLPWPMQSSVFCLDDRLAARLSQNGPPTAARYDWSAVMDRLEQTLLRVAA